MILCLFVSNGYFRELIDSEVEKEAQLSIQLFHFSVIIFFYSIRMQWA